MLAFDSDRSLQSLMIELGHKMPHYCRSLLHPDHKILNYLQFSDENERIEEDVLSLEKMLSPFLILVVCEKIYIEHAIQDHAVKFFSPDECKRICEIYSQVLVDFDCLISLLTGMSENVTTDEQTDMKTESTCDLQLSGSLGATTMRNSTTCAARVHRRTMNIIGDFCTLIGMRLATLDVLNSMDGNAEASPNVMQTLDRIIACPKLAMSRHTCPLIERASSEARALRKYFLTRRALLENRYADATVLLFEYKQLLNALDGSYSHYDTSSSASSLPSSKKNNSIEKFRIDSRSDYGSNKLYNGRRGSGTGIQGCESVAHTELKGISNSSSINSFTERKKVPCTSCNEEAEEHATKSAMFLLLSSFLEKLKNAHSSVFKDILDYSSALISSGAVDRSHTAASSLYNCERTSNFLEKDGGPIQQSIQGFGILESRIPSIFVKSPNSSSSSNTNSNSNSNVNSPDCDPLVGNNKHAFFKDDSKINESQLNHNDSDEYCKRLFLDIPRNGFICPSRSKWTSTHTTMTTTPTSGKFVF